MILFTANFEKTSINRPDYDFDDIDYLVAIVDDLMSNDDEGDFDPDDIEITMHKIGSEEGDLIKFISNFDDLGYELMVEIGDGAYDEYWEEGGDKYYQYKYLVTNNSLSAEEAMEKCNQVEVFQGSGASYAESYMDDVYDIPSNLINYIDYDAFANDLERDGCITELEDDVWIVNANSI